VAGRCDKDELLEGEATSGREGDELIILFLDMEAFEELLFESEGGVPPIGTCFLLNLVGERLMVGSEVASN
jgi:hypothetical protein